jgi:hypothetical protein
MKKRLLPVPALFLAGCDPISLTALGIGARAGVVHEMSGYTTRLRSVARRNTLFMDSATATEIIVQTERVLAGA